MKIAPSILSADFTRLGEQIRQVEEAGADWLHVDVMDGRFVPNISIGVPVVRSLRDATRLLLDVHLMIREPARYLEDFARAGADRITLHVEAEPHLHRALARIRELGCAPGISLNPGTPLILLEESLAWVDLVLLMTVNPGFGGQSFLPGSLDRVRSMRRKIDEREGRVLLEVDGGIGPRNAEKVVAAGCDVLVAGSAVFGTDDPGAALRRLRAAAEKGARLRSVD